MLVITRKISYKPSFKVTSGHFFLGFCKMLIKKARLRWFKSKNAESISLIAFVLVQYSVFLKIHLLGGPVQLNQGLVLTLGRVVEYKVLQCNS